MSGKTKKESKTTFNVVVSAMEEKERSFSLYFLISTLFLVVLISVAVVMDSKEADCPFVPKKVSIFVELPHIGANAPNGVEPMPVARQVDSVIQALEKSEIPGFLLDWRQNYSTGISQVVDQLPWSLIEFKDTKSSILKDNSISLKTVLVEGTKETQQALCEQTTRRCPHDNQIDLQKPLIANLDIFDTSPIFQRCLKQSGKTDAVSTLSNVVRSFPRGIHPEFFANSNTALTTVKKFRTRSLVLGWIQSEGVSGERLKLTLTEVSDSLQVTRKEASDPTSPMISPRYLLGLRGELGDPFTKEADQSLRSLRHFFRKTLIENNLIVSDDESLEMQELRAKKFKKLITHNPCP